MRRVGDCRIVMVCGRPRDVCCVAVRPMEKGVVCVSFSGAEGLL
jgi:hypothetical protein